MLGWEKKRGLYWNWGFEEGGGLVPRKGEKDLCGEGGFVLGGGDLYWEGGSVQISGDFVFIFWRGGSWDF